MRRRQKTSSFLSTTDHRSKSAKVRRPRTTRPVLSMLFLVNSVILDTSNLPSLKLSIEFKTLSIWILSFESFPISSEEFGADAAITRETEKSLVRTIPFLGRTC